MAEESQTEPVGTQYKFISNFTQGIRKDLRSDALPDEAGLTVYNVTLREGIVAVDKGYAQFMSGIEGSPQAIFQNNYPNGTSDLLLVATTTVFERLAGQWVYSIGSDGTNIHRTTLTAAAAKDATVINVASATGMVAGGKIGVRYISSTSLAITATTKAAKSIYRVSGEQVFNSGDKIVVTGYAVATWNVEQTVDSISVAGDATYTDITTTLDSAAFANTTSTDPKIERFGASQEHRTTIDSISTLAITLDDALPGRALKLAGVVLPITLAGQTEYIPDYVTVPSWTLAITGSTNATISGTAVVTNYIDEPFFICKGAGGSTVRFMSLDKITVSPFTDAANDLTDFRAKTVELWNNKLVFGRCIENGTNHGSRVRMSCAFDGLTSSLKKNFTSDDGGEVYELVSGDSNIQSIRLLGKLLIVYKRSIIYRGDYTGGINASTRFQSTIMNEGAISTHAIVQVPGKHYVVGTKNIYEYTGGLTLKNIGDPIREDLYTPDRFANVTMKEFIHCVYDPELQEFLLFYPEGTVKGMRKAFRYSEQNKAWSARTYAHFFNFANTFRSTETLTWGQLNQPWSNYNQPWVSAFFVTEKLHRFLLGQGELVGPTGNVDTETAYVFDANSVATTDNVYTIPWQYDTKDFYLPNSFIRVDFLDLYSSGDDVTLWYSEDLGNIWTRVRALEPKSTIEQERVHLNKAAKRIRFRLKGSSSNFQLGWMGFSFTPEFSW